MDSISTMYPYSFFKEIYFNEVMPKIKANVSHSVLLNGFYKKQSISKHIKS
jgi:hypothetical protein